MSSRLERTYECNICQRAFESLESLEIHRKSHDSTEQALYKTNEASSSQVPNLRQQKNRPVFLKCSVCHKNFGNASNLRLHEKAHRFIPIKPRQPQKTFKRRNNREFFQSIVPIRCSFCGKEFVRQSNLTKHEKLHKERLKYYLPKRKVFQESYIERAQLQTDLSRNFDFSEPPKNSETIKEIQAQDESCVPCPGIDENTQVNFVSCEICEQIFDSPEALEIHKLLEEESHLFSSKDENTQVNFITCKICGQNFDCPEELEAHKLQEGESHLLFLKDNSTQVNFIFCVYCGRSFDCLESLKKHQLTHIEKP